MLSHLPSVVPFFRSSTLWALRHSVNLLFRLSVVPLFRFIRAICVPPGYRLHFLKHLTSSFIPIFIQIEH